LRQNYFREKVSKYVKELIKKAATTVLIKEADTILAVAAIYEKNYLTIKKTPRTTKLGVTSTHKFNHNHNVTVVFSTYF
jgi:hypothetical protein